MTITQDNPAELRTLRKQLLLARSQLSRLRLKQETLLLRTWAVRGRQVVETSLLLWSVRKGWSLFQGIRQARRAGVTARSAVQMHDGPPLTPGYPEGGGAGNRLAIELALGAITAMAKLVKGLRRTVPTGSATPDI